MDTSAILRKVLLMQILQKQDETDRMRKKVLHSSFNRNIISVKTTRISGLFRRESVGFSLDAIVFLARHYLFLSQVYFRGINVGESDKSSGSVIKLFRLNR